MIESGERNISMMDLLLLAKSLKTTTSALIYDSKDKVSVSDALRADKDLSDEDRAVIEQIYLKFKDRKDGNS